MNSVQRAVIPPVPRPMQPLNVNQMAKHHFNKLEGQTLGQSFTNPTVTVHGSFDGVYGVIDFGAIQITGGVRWDQVFSKRRK